MASNNIAYCLALVVTLLTLPATAQDPRKLAQALMKRDPSQDSEIPF